MIFHPKLKGRNALARDFSRSETANTASKAGVSFTQTTSLERTRSFVHLCTHREYFRCTSARALTQPALTSLRLLLCNCYVGCCIILYFSLFYLFLFCWEYALWESKLIINIFTKFALYVEKSDRICALLIALF